MNGFDVWFVMMFAFVGGSIVGYLFAIDRAKRGELRGEGISYSYFDTRKYRIHRAAR